LGNFKQLQHLELDWTPDKLQHLELDRPPFELKSIELVNLQILHLKYIREEITLSTPKLKILECDDLSKIIFCYPQAIQFLSLAGYEEERDDFTKLTNIQNLIIQSRSITNIEPFFKLEKLKVLSFYTIHYKIVEEILKRKSKNLKVYCDHVEIENEDKLNEWRSTGDLFKFRLNNYNLWDDQIIRIPPYIDYKYLISKWPTFDQIPNSFFKKFAISPKIIVDLNVENPNDLQMFLSRFKYIKGLRLHQTGLNQWFYDQLPSICKEIGGLNIKEYESFYKLEFHQSIQVFGMCWLICDFKTISKCSYCN